MKTFGELKVGDRIAMVYKYDLNHTCDIIYTVVDIININNEVINITVRDAEGFFNSKDFIYIDNINKFDTLMLDNKTLKRIIVPIENYNYIQKIYNMIYITSSDDTKANIRNALGIYP